MRLPCKVDDPDKIHFLSDFYIKQFNLSIVPFNNSDEDCLLKFYNDSPVSFVGMFYFLRPLYVLLTFYKNNL